MRPTKSKQKLFYHKKLRSLERKKWELEKQARESELYEEIPRTLMGYKVHLEVIESLRNKEEGLSEAKKIGNYRALRITNYSVF